MLVLAGELTSQECVDPLIEESLPRGGFVADVYDAMVSERTYKDAFSPVVAKNIIIEGAGTQFDQRIVTAFTECEPKFTEVCDRNTSLTAVTI